MQRETKSFIFSTLHQNPQMLEKVDFTVLVESLIPGHN